MLRRNCKAGSSAAGKGPAPISRRRPSRVQVLTSGMWPQTSATATCQLPRELEQCTTEFASYYLAANSGGGAAPGSPLPARCLPTCTPHAPACRCKPIAALRPRNPTFPYAALCPPPAAAGRRLTWQTSLGTADLKASFGGGTRRHELQCSTCQMAVLMLFNDAERLSYEEVAAASGIPEAELKRVLQSLACVKVCVRVCLFSVGVQGEKWDTVGMNVCLWGRVEGQEVPSRRHAAGILRTVGLLCNN